MAERLPLNPYATSQAPDEVLCRCPAASIIAEYLRGRITCRNEGTTAAHRVGFGSRLSEACYLYSAQSWLDRRALTGQ